MPRHEEWDKGGAGVVKMGYRWYDFQTRFFDDGSCSLLLHSLGPYLPNRGIITDGTEHSLKKEFSSPEELMLFAAGYFELEQSVHATTESPIWTGRWNKGDRFTTDETLGLVAGSPIWNSHYLSSHVALA